MVNSPKRSFQLHTKDNRAGIRLLVLGAVVEGEGMKCVVYPIGNKVKIYTFLVTLLDIVQFYFVSGVF